MKLLNLNFVILVFLLLSNTSYSQETESKLDSKERMETTEIKGTITDINTETREITLEGENGEMETITADDSIERFDELEVGDVVVFEYVKYLKAEFREPTPEELEEPLVVLAEAGKATKDQAPAGAIGAVIKAVVTIQTINLPLKFVTIQGPAGNYTTIDVEDEELLKKLYVGQVVILKYIEAMAVSVEKAN